MKSAANAVPVNMAHKDAAARRMDVTGMMAHLPQMPVAVWFRGALPLIAFALFSCVAQCPGATILAKFDIRLWQTVHDRAAPLTWSWEEGADAATLTFSNRVSRTVWSHSVSRALGDQRGSCVQPAPTEGETVVDVVLVQKAGANEVARESATLAYVAGAGGGPITVRAAMQAPARELAKVPKPRVYAFDSAWLGETGDSGYAVAWPLYRPLKIILR